MTRTVHPQAEAIMNSYSRVYSVQCRTFEVLREILGIAEIGKDQGYATGPNHPFVHFRVLPAYRDAYSLKLRKAVADRMRARRSAAACSYCGFHRRDGCDDINCPRREQRP